MIKNLLTLITFLPLFLSAQTSWVAFRLETDTHPEEFSWYVEDVATGDTVDQGGPYGGVLMVLLVKERKLLNIFLYRLVIIHYG